MSQVAPEYITMRPPPAIIDTYRVQQDGPVVRTFTTGANRDVVDNKPDYEAYLCPLVLERFGEYMMKHQHLRDGTVREGDNWQKGMPRAVYLKSMMRHVFDLWKLQRGYTVLDRRTGEALDAPTVLCSILFNVQGLLHELLLGRSV